MKTHLLFALPAAAVATSAAAQDIDYETGEYEYAQPAPELDDDVVTETVTTEPDAQERGAERVIPMRQAPSAPVFVGNPVVQPTGEEIAPPSAYARPTVYAPPQPAAAQPPAVVVQRQPVQPAPVYVTYPAGQAPILYAYPAAYGYAPNGGAARVIYREGQSQPAPVAYGYQPGYAYAGAPTYLPASAQIVEFDRTAWLEECRARLDTYEESDRGKVIGALLGAAAGGVIGNRVAGSGNRTAGTLVGAGTGALAGAAVGDAIDDRNDARRDSYGQCQAYLDDYMARAQAEAGRTYYTQGGQYMLVPVMVAVPQRAVYADGTPAN